jgi:hypothetical protein
MKDETAKICSTHGRYEKIQILAEKPQRKRLVGRSRRLKEGWEDDDKMDPREMWCHDLGKTLKAVMKARVP